jgi:hypothetical protein
MTRVPLDGRPLGLTMLCINSSSMRLLLHTDADSPVWGHYYPTITRLREYIVRVHFPLHPDETVTMAWVRARNGYKPVLKVRCAKGPCS